MTVRDDPTIVSDLEQLAALHEQGLLSDADFAAAKARLLGDVGESSPVWGPSPDNGPNNPQDSDTAFEAGTSPSGLPDISGTVRPEDGKRGPRRSAWLALCAVLVLAVVAWGWGAVRTSEDGALPASGEAGTQAGADESSQVHSGVYECTDTIQDTFAVEPNGSTRGPMSAGFDLKAADIEVGATTVKYTFAVNSIHLRPYGDMAPYYFGTTFFDGSRNELGTVVFGLGSDVASAEVHPNPEGFLEPRQHHNWAMVYDVKEERVVEGRGEVTYDGYKYTFELDRADGPPIIEGGAWNSFGWMTLAYGPSPGVIEGRGGYYDACGSNPNHGDVRGFDGA